MDNKSHANEVVSVINDSSILLVIDGEAFTVPSDHPNFSKIRTRLTTGMYSPTELVELVDATLAMVNFAKGEITIDGGRVMFRGREVKNGLTTKITEMMAAGIDAAPMLMFLENLMQNPSMTSINELYDFLELYECPLTTDGHFLSYKAVREDYLDIYSSTIDNSVGNEVVVDRASVDDNRDQGCSAGLHAGALEYVKSYGNGGNSGSRLMVVKINPRDVVSVPTHCTYQKIRVCKYTVIGEIDWKDVMPDAPVVDDNLNAVGHTPKADPVDAYALDEYDSAWLDVVDALESAVWSDHDMHLLYAAGFHEDTVDDALDVFFAESNEFDRAHGVPSSRAKLLTIVAQVEAYCGIDSSEIPEWY